MTRRAATLLLCLTLLVGCDEPAAPDVGPTPEPRDARPTSADFSILAVLPANRPTRLAVDRDGKPFWTQLDPDREAMVLTLDEGGLPRPTALTAARVLQAIGESGGAGQFVSLLGDAGGGLLFHFVGRNQRKPISVVGRYRPVEGDIQTVVNTATLLEVSTLGPSLMLARSELLGSPSTPRLWLWTLDDSVLLSLEPDGPKLLTPRIVNEKDRPLGGESDDWQVGLIDDALWMLDAGEPRLVRVGQSGRITRGIDLPIHADYPANLVPLPGRDDTLVVFAIDRPSHRPLRLRTTIPPHLPFETPALLLVNDKSITPIARDRLRAPVGVPLQTLRITALVGNPRDGSLLAYDSGGGFLLRIQPE